MNKWKCDICKKGFDNFHAQGFDNKIYCPLCFFKEENRRLQQKLNQLEANINTAIDFIDQVLQYHLSPFDYKQADEDINTLIGMLRSGSNE